MEIKPSFVQKTIVRFKSLSFFNNNNNRFLQKTKKQKKNRESGKKKGKTFYVTVNKDINTDTHGL